MSVVEWNDRFSVDEYIFGKDPNDFLVREVSRLNPGALVLCVSDGEGRNGVWLAEQGFRVHSIDVAPAALAKSKALASERGVKTVGSLDELVKASSGGIYQQEVDIYSWEWPADYYDAVVAIFIQFVTPDMRQQVFDWLADALKPGGLLLLEGYHSRQIKYGTGGPPNVEQLYTVGLLNGAFPKMRIESLTEYDVEINEGELHKGVSALIDLIGVRLPN